MSCPDAIAKALQMFIGPSESVTPEARVCPECNGKLAFYDGCDFCPDCGYSKCG